jgi:predicted Zn finger-like uncharacterized protein
MRLICPNCGAQYEVPDEVIPLDGRDVQCSNCGDTWFQSHPDHAQATDDDLETLTADDDAEEQDQAPEPEDQPETKPEKSAEPKPDAEEKPRRDIDPAVAEILQQEAAHEASKRSSEKSSNLETQPDLGLQAAEDDATRRSREARERMARMRGEGSDTPVADNAADALGSRRDLLPDIDEINSTLRSASDRQTDIGDAGVYEDVEIMRKRSGFRRGFTMTILIAAILAVIYVFAPKISETVPQAEPALNSYVILVDNGRVVLDGYVTSILEWLDEKASGGAGG